MKTLKKYINEWQLTDKSAKHIDKKEVVIYKEFPQSIEELQRIIIDRLKKNNECPYLLDINTSKITDMYRLFSDLEYSRNHIDRTLIKKIDIHTWDTSNVTNMDGMFSRLHGLESIDMTNLSINSLKSTLSMFYNCSSLNEIKGMEEWKNDERISQIRFGSDLFYNVKDSAIPSWVEKYCKPI